MVAEAEEGDDKRAACRHCHRFTGRRADRTGRGFHQDWAGVNHGLGIYALDDHAYAAREMTTAH